MAHSRSAKKRVRQNIKRRVHNRHYRTMTRSQSKEIAHSVKTGNKEEAMEKLASTVATIQRAAGKGVFHRNKASNLVSKLSRQISKMS